MASGNQCSQNACPSLAFLRREYEFSGLDYWTGLLDWTTGLDYWIGLLDWLDSIASTTQRVAAWCIVCMSKLRPIYIYNF